MLCDTDRDLGACDASQREGLVQVVKQIVAGLCYYNNYETRRMKAGISWLLIQ